MRRLQFVMISLAIALAIALALAIAPALATALPGPPTPNLQVLVELLVVLHVAVRGDVQHAVAAVALLGVVDVLEGASPDTSLRLPICLHTWSMW